MRRLQKRVRKSGGNHKQAMADYTPAPTQATVSGGSASPQGSPDVMPLALVTVYPQPGGQYSTLGYQGLAPIFTADGAAVPATSPGRWAQLAMAGRP
jgi:hypothetical protein